MKQSKQTSYAIPFLADQLKDRLRSQKNAINLALAVLKRYGEIADLATLQEYRQNGADWKCEKAMQQVEDYIVKTDMPSMLQPDARRRAFDAVSDEFVVELSQKLDSIGDFDTTTLFFCDSWHEWRFTEKYEQSEIEKLRITISEEEETLLDRFIEAVQIVDDLERLGCRARAAIAGGVVSSRTRGALAYALLFMRRKPEL